ncbi:hypothetical protein GDO81_004127 [Engystomops pustulosus]|uniref:Uncharacterized protein n=1 Tax=Engystomops pustulosus TaxID=76066 RepID=A0AAV6ZYN1_ENGPU|nr:hypothetical protein GDO81_004127 [Engystomops pustulosus]
MKCTKIGGSDDIKGKITCLSGFLYVYSRAFAMSGVSLYAHKITSEFFDPTFWSKRYELGAALFHRLGRIITYSVIGGAILCLSLNDSIKKARINYSYNGVNSVRSAHTPPRSEQQS